MSDRNVRIGLIQTAVSHDLEKNLEKALGYVESAIHHGAEILCLQELFRTPYFPQEERCDFSAFAEPIPGPTTRIFSDLARENRVTIVVPLFEHVPPQEYYNSAVVIGTHGEISTPYRKIHVPFDPLYYEKNYFRPGDEYLVVDTGCARIAVLICYDQWFPEAARTVTLRGAEILFYPTAIGWIKGMERPAEGDWREAWQLVQRGHAIANNVHIAAVNRVGSEGDLLFWGGSFVCDSFGNVLKRAGDLEDEIVLVEVDLRKNQEVRQGWRFLQNRRPDTYPDMLTDGFFGAQSVATRIETPRKCGFSMPAEWEPHEGIWLAWPYREETFPHLQEVTVTYARMIHTIHLKERVHLLVRHATMEAHVRTELQNLGVQMDLVDLHITDYADVWLRDSGPTFVMNRKEKKLALVGWKFNAWGEKYTDLVRDEAIPIRLKEMLGLPLFKPGIILEGGSIDVNGRGIVMTTEQCLLNPNRNPTLSRREIERYLQEYLGVERVLWLQEGIAGDDTDGHIDDIARFADPKTILCAVEEDRSDENFSKLQGNLHILQKARDQEGNSFRVIPVPMPDRIEGDTRLPASYLNFYIGNQIVLVPVFGVKNDACALNIISKAFPKREVVGIDCQALVQGLGTLHCVSQQQPVI